MRACGQACHRGRERARACAACRFAISRGGIGAGIPAYAALADRRIAFSGDGAVSGGRGLRDGINGLCGHGGSNRRKRCIDILVGGDAEGLVFICRAKQADDINLVARAGSLRAAAYRVAFYPGGAEGCGLARKRADGSLIDVARIDAADKRASPGDERIGRGDVDANDEVARAPGDVRRWGDLEHDAGLTRFNVKIRAADGERTAWRAAEGTENRLRLCAAKYGPARASGNRACARCRSRLRVNYGHVDS